MKIKTPMTRKSSIPSTVIPVQSKKPTTLYSRMVERIKEKFESYSPLVFPERPRYLDALYRMVARAYIDPRNLLRFRPEDEDRRILQLRRLVGLKGPKLPRDEELAWRPTLDVKRALRTCRERLALARRPLEILWIFHELCKLFLEIRRYDMARYGGLTLIIFKTCDVCLNDKLL